MNIIEAIIGKTAIEKIIVISVKAVKLYKENPVFYDEVAEELDQEIISIIKDELSYKMNPEEVLISMEQISLDEFSEIFGEYYATEIERRVNTGDDTEC